MKFELRAVERAFSGQDREFQPGRPRGRCQHRFRAIPDRIVAGTRRRPRRQRHVALPEPEVCVDRLQQLAEPRDFIFDLVGQAKYMSVVLRKCTRAHEAVQCTGRFGAMDRAEFAISDR